MQITPLIKLHRNIIILDLFNLIFFILACIININVTIYPWYSSFLTLIVIIFFYLAIFNILSSPETGKYLKQKYLTYYQAQPALLKVLLVAMGIIYSLLQNLFFIVLIYFFDGLFSQTLSSLQGYFIQILFFLIVPFGLLMIRVVKFEYFPIANIYFKSLFFTLICIGLPAFGLWTLLMDKITGPLVSEAKPWKKLRKYSYASACALFSVITTSILYMEYAANVNFHNNPGWLMEGFFSRTFIFFLAIYLPFKLLLHLMNLKPSNRKFELIWNCFIFFCQLAILYLFLK